MDTIQLLDAEIAQVTKSSKPVHVRLQNTGNGIYKGFLPLILGVCYIVKCLDCSS